MGVRFQCPNGHKLHVKAELAGRRGACPECGARFVVPSFTGGRVALDDGVSAGLSTPAPVSGASGAADAPTDSVFIKTQPRSGIAAPTAPPSANPLAPAEPAASGPISEPVAWYVRPAAGGQFGPATTEMFQQWLEEGRVAMDSWVWRTGWADWKPGSEALATATAVGSLAAARPSLPVAAAASSAPEIDDGIDMMPTATTGLADSGMSVRRDLQRRKQRARVVSTAMAIVALVTLVVLLIVLAR